MAQFGNALTFKHVNDSDINDVEKLIRNKMIDKIERDMNDSVSGAGEADELLIDDDMKKEYFGDVYYKEPNDFEFLPGDLKLIKLLVDHVRSNVDTNGINKGLKHYQNRKKSNCKSTHKLSKKRLKHITRISTEIDEHISNNVDVNESEPEQLSQIEAELFEKILQCMKSYNVDEIVSLQNVTKNIVSVSSQKDHIYGLVNCLICERNVNKTKIKPKKVSYHDGWIVSNFTTHLQNVHKLCDKTRRAKIIKDDVSDQNSVTLSEIKDAKIEYVEVEVIKSDMQQKWYAQISAQITAKAQTAFSNGEAQSQMLIMLTEKDRKVITVVPTPTDGNCMFSALSHQLFGFKMDSIELKSAQKKMRADVV